MKLRLLEISLFLSTLLSGLYAGIGFIGVMSTNETIRLMTAPTFAEYWQHTDHLMGTRMPIFGPIFLLSVIFSCILLFKYKFRKSFWLMLAGLLMLVFDIVFTVTTNHPLNEAVQRWDLSALPTNVLEVRDSVADAFQLRALLMMGAFVLVLLSVWSRPTRIADISKSA